MGDRPTVTVRGTAFDGKYQVVKSKEGHVVLEKRPNRAKQKRPRLRPKGDTYDKTRRRVGRENRRTFWDLLFPRRHGRWWNYDVTKQCAKTEDELYASLMINEPCESDTEEERAAKVADAQAKLDHVEAIAQTAVDRASAADRRASTIAATVAIAASFTLSGAGLVIETGKFDDQGLRIAAAATLAATAVFFAVSAAFALGALVWARQWHWPDPHGLEHAGEPYAKRLGKRAANLLDNFGFNWELSDQKIRLVDHALKFVLCALIGVVSTAVIVLIDVIRST